MTGRGEILMKAKFATAALLTALLGALACAPASAHHSFAVFFDSEDGVMSVRGIVTEFNFRNPHGVIRLNVKVKSGAVQEWKAETNSPSILERRGWKKDSLKVGDEIVVEGWRARDGANYMRMRKVTRADGTPIGVPFASLEVK
jgi:proline racemase